MAKLRGSVSPMPSYTPDVAGLLRWLRQPPSQWSACGWQNAPAWADAISDLVSFLEKERDRAVVERDETIEDRDLARRLYCELMADLCTNIPTLYRKPRNIAELFGWNCFDGIEEVGNG